MQYSVNVPHAEYRVVPNGHVHHFKSPNQPQSICDRVSCLPAADRFRRKSKMLPMLILLLRETFPCYGKLA